MQDLLSHRVRVSRMSRSSIDGRPAYSWVPVPGLESVPTRLDLTFLRPGRDSPPAQEAGTAVDRVGVAFFDRRYGALLRPGDRLTAVSFQGRRPVDGTFAIKSFPDPAQGLLDVEHFEVAVQEVAQLVVT